jgi:hypothetical protein
MRSSPNANDIPYAVAATSRHRAAPYDGLARPRLLGTDSDGVKWSGGYTIPRIADHHQLWTFAGEIDGLVTDDQSPTVETQASTELMFPLRIGDPMTIALARFVRTLRPGTKLVREYEVKALGTSIRFAFEADSSTLVVTAAHSPDLPIPFAECWITEPLRILFGQPIFPRLTARNRGVGRATVWIGRSPGLVKTARWASLLGSDNVVQEDKEFWALYAQLVELVASARDENGQPDFDKPHKITRLYDEVIQASRGSRWVWALTFASAIEALVQMMIPKGTKAADADLDAIEAVASYVDRYLAKGPAEARLKGIAMNAIKRTGNVNTYQAMRELRDKKVVSGTQVAAWEKIRNAVAHGSLLLPYSNEEEDEQLMALAAMMHALTREAARRSMRA